MGSTRKWTSLVHIHPCISIGTSLKIELLQLCAASVVFIALEMLSLRQKWLPGRCWWSVRFPLRLKGDFFWGRFFWKTLIFTKKGKKFILVFFSTIFFSFYLGIAHENWPQVICFSPSCLLVDLSVCSTCLRGGISNLSIFDLQL